MFRKRPISVTINVENHKQLQAWCQDNEASVSSLLDAMAAAFISDRELAAKVAGKTQSWKKPCDFRWDALDAKGNPTPNEKPATPNEPTNPLSTL